MPNRDSTGTRRAAIYRMVMPGHLCPWGLKARDLLRRHGFAVDDHLLASPAEVDAFRAAHGVKTTPQVFIEGQRVGGYEDLRRHLGLPVRDANAPTYRPVLAVFGVAALMAVAATQASMVATALAAWARALQWFVAFGMCLLAMLKLQDLERFATMFLNYDLLARRWVPYAYLYPFAELTAGVLMLAGTGRAIAVPVALVAGGIGAVSVFKAVYIERRTLRCACVGASGNVPLGPVSLAENLAMVGMAVWMVTGGGMAR